MKCFVRIIELSLLGRIRFSLSLSFSNPRDRYFFALENGIMEIQSQVSHEPKSVPFHWERSLTRYLEVEEIRFLEWDGKMAPTVTVYLPPQ